MIKGGERIGRTPYATKPPKMPDHPLKEYHTSGRKGTSGCEYQIDVSTAIPGVTIASMVPKKNLGGKSQHYDTEVKSVRFGAPVEESLDLDFCFSFDC